MMSDILLRYYPSRAEFDLSVNASNTDLELDDGLETASNISLFTDAQPSPEELPAGATGLKGGSWIDALTESADKIGSYLWALSRKNIIDKETSMLVDDFTHKSLKWMIDDGVAKSVDVQVTRLESRGYNIEISINKPDKTVYKYKTIWESIWHS
jgi:phage gp46-like protein